MSARGRFEGWPLVGWAVLGIAAMTGAVFAWQGVGEDGYRALLRATARSSLLLLLAAYCARPFHQLLRSDTTRFLLRNRRQLGVSMAASHGVHAAAIYLLISATGEWPDTTTVVAGNLAFVLLAGMAASSNDAAVRALGRPRWQRLHRTGLHYVWAVFLLTYAGQAAAGSALALAATALLLTAAAARGAAWWRGRRQRRTQ